MFLTNFPNMKFLFFFLNSSANIFFFLAALGIRCCAQASLVEQVGATLRCGVRASHCSGFSCCGAGLQAHGLQQLWHMGSVVVAHGLQSAGSVVVAHGPSCSAACGIFPDQGSNPRPLHQQADSQPLLHQGSPRKLLFVEGIQSLLTEVRELCTNMPCSETIRSQTNYLAPLSLSFPHPQHENSKDKVIGVKIVTCCINIITDFFP